MMKIILILIFVILPISSFGEMVYVPPPEDVTLPSDSRIDFNHLSKDEIWIYVEQWAKLNGFLFDVKAEYATGDRGASVLEKEFSNTPEFALCGQIKQDGNFIDPQKVALEYRLILYRTENNSYEDKGFYIGFNLTGSATWVQKEFQKYKIQCTTTGRLEQTINRYIAEKDEIIEAQEEKIRRAEELSPVMRKCTNNGHEKCTT